MNLRTIIILIVLSILLNSKFCDAHDNKRIQVKIDSIQSRIESGLYKESEPRDHLKIALRYRDLGKSSEAMKHVNNAIFLARELKDYNQTAEYLMYKKDISLGFYLDQQIRDEKLLKISDEVLAIFDSVTDYRVRSRIWSHKAERIESQYADYRSNDSLLKINVRYRSRAIEALKKYSIHNPEINVNYSIDSRSIDLANSYADNNQMDSALIYAKRVLEPKVYEAQSVVLRPNILLFAYCALSTIYTLENMHEEAIFSLDSTLLYTKKIESTDPNYKILRDWAYSVACWAYVELKDYEKAYSTMLMRYEVRNEDFNEKRLIEMGKAEVHLKYVVDSITAVKHSENQLNEIKLKSKQNNWLISALLITLILLFIIVLSVRKLRIKNRMVELQKNLVDETNEELNTANDNYEMLLIESNHRIKNNLQMILSMIEFKAIQSGDKSEELDKISGNIQAISTLHKYLSFDIHNQNVNLFQYLQEIVALFTEIKPHNFEINSDLTSLEIPSERIVYFGLIFNEMLSNTIEHSFSKVTNIAVDIIHEDDKSYSFTYTDGSSWEKNINTGLGTTLISGLVERINGKSFNLDSTKGTYYFKFDVEA